MKVLFFEETPAVPDYDSDVLCDWIAAVAELYGKRVGGISYLFCDDEKILQVNNSYLQHDYYTDIITFDYSSTTTIKGDIFISVDTVRSNAESLQVDLNTEFHRIIIHGILHLCGIHDKTDEERADMTKKENEALLIFDKLIGEDR